MEAIFEDRKDAGKKLADVLKERNFTEPVVLALPRGGVVVAQEVAEALGAPVDVVIARKIGAPGQREFGIGALSEDGVPTFNPDIQGYIDTGSAPVEEIIAEETNEMQRRIELYREGKPLPEMKERSVIVVDDGIATGVTAVAAAKFLRTLEPKELILAVPVGPDDLGAGVRQSFDEVICLHALSNLRAVGIWYEDFGQTEDDEVLGILKKYH